MRTALFRVAIAAAIACVVLAPALIWSGQKPSSSEETAGQNQAPFKEKPVFTVGPPMTPEELAAREEEKRLSFPEAGAWAREHAGVVDRSGRHPWQLHPETAPPGDTGHPGLTPAEMQKLEAIRSGALRLRDDRSTWPQKPDLKCEEIDVPLRPLGAEGLTPEEKAKLEASRKLRNNANRDEGGRSR